MTRCKCGHFKGYHCGKDHRNSIPLKDNHPHCHGYVKTNDGWCECGGFERSEE